MNPVLSIIIVNYNGKRFLADCLESITKRVSCSHEVIIVDNASADGSVAFIRQNFPTIQLIVNPENSGFSVANNIGVRVAKGKWILLLNNDTLLLTDVLPGIELLAARPDIGVVGAKMLGRQNEYRFSAGHFPSPLRLIRISSMYRRDGAFGNGGFELGEGLLSCYTVDWIEGSFLLTRAELWERLGGLDEGSFMYGEDVDFCKRVKLVGFSCVYQPSIEFVHYGGYGTGRLPLVVKGFLRYHKRHSGAMLRSLVFCILASKLVATYCIHALLFVFTRSVASREKANACKSALGMAVGRR